MINLKSGELITPPYLAFMQQAVRILLANDQHVLELEPAAYQHFACSGCGLCCQRPWGLSISREYYQQWYQTFDSHPSGLYREPFRIQPRPDESNYADIRRKPGTGECIFLMDDRRCFVQATYGEAALNDGCRAFPRYEGWFGAFLGRFMITSCPEVHDLAWQFPGIRYTIGKVAAEKWGEMLRLPHPLGLYQGYLWLGVCLDLIGQPGLTPVQALRSLGSWLARLPATLADTPLELLLTLQPASSAPVSFNPSADPRPAFERLLELLAVQPTVQAYVADVSRGLRRMPVLQPDEAGLMQSFLRSWLAYRCLSANYSSGSAVDFFFPFYYLLSLQLNLLQWLALYYRDREGGVLGREQLLRAATVVGYRYEQGPGLIAPLRQLSRAQCLEGMTRQLVFDWSAGRV